MARLGLIRGFLNGTFRSNITRTPTLDVSDMAEVAAIALNTEDHFGKIYKFSGLSYTAEEVATILSEVVGRKISFIDVPAEVANQSMLDNQMPAWMVESMSELNYITKKGWTDGYSEDFKKITGREYTSAKQFFINNLSHFRSTSVEV